MPGPLAVTVPLAVPMPVVPRPGPGTSGRAAEWCQCPCQCQWRACHWPAGQCGASGPGPRPPTPAVCQCHWQWHCTSRCQWLRVGPLAPAGSPCHGASDTHCQWQPGSTKYTTTHKSTGKVKCRTPLLAVAQSQWHWHWLCPSESAEAVESAGVTPPAVLLGFAACAFVSRCVCAEKHWH